MITPEQINLLKDVIVKTMQPKKVYLFGNYAHVIPNEDRDLDILIEVKKTHLPKVERNLEVWNAMDKYKQLHFPKDIFVFTTEEMNDWKDLKNSFINNALYQSKTFYERN